MRFLIDADLPRRTSSLLQRLGHEGIDVRDIGMTSAIDPDIAQYAQSHGLCLLTGDFGFADVRNYPPEEYAGIVVLELPRRATSETTMALIKSFVTQDELITRLPGRLAVVEFGRVRFRPA